MSSRALADSDLARADELLASATDQVQTMIGDIRRLIYGLRPPALDQLRLLASRRALAAQQVPRGSELRVDAPSSLPALPAAVEVSAYWIAQEALTNITRHANARSCHLRLAVETTVLRLEIEDDGTGLATATAGVGLQTMRERATEVGGTCEIGSGAMGGTLVAAMLPWRVTDR